MHRVFIQVLRSIVLVSLIVGFVGAGQAAAAGGKNATGNVYTMTNAAAGNMVLAFDRSASGALSPAGSLATGGLGNSAALGSQGSLTLSRDGKWLFAVNAGSNNISVLATGGGMALADKVPSGGTTPISVTANKKLVYVLNAGGVPNISGFEIGKNGHLSPIAGSTRSLLGTGPAEVMFSPSGDVLVVTDKTTNTIETFVVDKHGVAGAPVSHPSHGGTPFGFAFGKRSQLFVSEAAGAPPVSAASSYVVGRDGGVTLVSGSVSTTQAAACWLVVTKNGKYAYTANAGSGSISSFTIANNGSITLLAAAAMSAPGSHPLDLALSRGSKFLYVLKDATHAIGASAVRKDGGLVGMADTTGLPVGATGLAAR